MNKEKIKEIAVVICVSYTVISLGIALTESIMAGTDMNFQDQFSKFLWTAISVCVLYTHPMLEQISPLAMIGLQYLAAQGLVFLHIWISGFFEELHPQAYFHAFRSFTIIYALGAAAYYAGVILEVKKQNQILSEIKEAGKNKKQVK